MAWLLRNGEVLASLELTGSRHSLVRELGGRDKLDCALIVRPGRSAHSLGLKIALDIAYLDDHLRVLATTRLGPYRIARPNLRSSAVLHAQAGAFDRWHLVPGDALEIKD
jgi:hypothetical protein